MLAGGLLYRGVEQLAAHQAHNLEVAGSNPAPAIGSVAGNHSRGADLVEPWVGPNFEKYL